MQLLGVSWVALGGSISLQVVAGFSFRTLGGKAPVCLISLAPRLPERSVRTVHMEAIQRVGLGLWRGLRGKYAESKMFSILFGFPGAETTTQYEETLPLLNKDIISKNPETSF